jgi:CTP synthase (UTP-ammonia lyase)
MNFGVAIAVVGDYEAERPSHKATNEALRHGAETLVLGVSTEWIPTQTLETDRARIGLVEYDGIFCAPGGPYSSMNGALEAIRFARERNWPFLGT